MAGGLTQEFDAAIVPRDEAVDCLNSPCHFGELAVSGGRSMNCRKLWNKGTPHLAVDAEKKQKAHPRADQNKRRTIMSTKMPAAPATSSTAGPWSLNYAHSGHIGGEG